MKMMKKKRISSAHFHQSWWHPVPIMAVKWGFVHTARGKYD
jgi:hypothetical protein